MSRDIRLKVQDARDGIEIERPVDVGEGLVGFIGPRFKLDLGLDPFRIDHQQDESVLARVESFRRRNHLRGCRAMDEALAREAGSGIEAVALRFGPFCFMSDVEDWSHSYVVMWFGSRVVK